MPNEVEIRITANDLTGPAVAGAIARMRALKAATQGLGFNDMSRGLNDSINKMSHLREEVNRLSFGKIDTSQLGSSLTALKSKIQALGIADIADVNVQPGKIMSQLQVVKRMVDQAGITDLLDVNVNTGDLAKQLDKIGNLTETIPVLFDMSKIPNFGTQSVIHVPIMFDVGKIPQFGDVQPILSAASAEGKLAKATEEANAAGYASGPIWSSSTRKIIDYAASLQSGTRYNGLFGDAELGELRRFASVERQRPSLHRHALELTVLHEDVQRLVGLVDVEVVAVDSGNRSRAARHRRYRFAR